MAQINKRVLQMRPPDFLVRLPRDLEKHFKNLKGKFHICCTVSQGKVLGIREEGMREVWRCLQLTSLLFSLSLWW